MLIRDASIEAMRVVMMEEQPAPYSSPSILAFSSYASAFTPLMFSFRYIRSLNIKVTSVPPLAAVRFPLRDSGTSFKVTSHPLDRLTISQTGASEMRCHD
ncbi:hypothetical protein E2C01_041482 [Portunus trituberculatus]|uniref:Uncharacterized protein n=1 Tax=Portunus trituberculatus TaxID=210409 RepID=A0A5B7FQU8_PORTR|nr:hypothetical protein [Portunus trituberculatus]